MTTTDPSDSARTSPPKRRRGLLGLSAGDIDRVLYAVVFVLVVLVIGALGYLVYAAIARPVAPRSEVERRVYFYEQGTKAQPSEPEVWELYATALIDAGQLSKAGSAIDEGLRRVDEDGGLLVVRARLERLRGRDDKALKTCDAAIKAVAVWREKAMAEAAAKGSGAPLAYSPDLVAAEIIKAEIYEDADKPQQAIEAYGRALAEKPQMADVLAARGDLYLKLGDDDAARKDYREALRYDPENAAATNGLKRLGDTKQ